MSRLPTAALAAAVGLIAFCAPAAAHLVEYALESGEATVISLHYADVTPFAFESYEIYASGESIPVQVGRSDLHGRIAFVPSRSGQWRLRAFSEDGHGVDFTFDADTVASVRHIATAPLSQGAKILIGLAILFGLFGVLSLVYRSRR